MANREGIQERVAGSGAERKLTLCVPLRSKGLDLVVLATFQLALPLI